MSRACPEKKNGRKDRAACIVLVAVTVLASIHPVPASAQDVELRGAVSDSAIESDQQRKTQQLATVANAQQQTGDQPAATDTTSQPYQPFSQGALAGDGSANAATTDSLFGSPAAADGGTDDNGLDGSASPAAPRKTMAGTTASTVSVNPKSSKTTKAKDGTTSTQTVTAPDGETGGTEDGAPNRRAPTVDSEDKIPLDKAAERTGSIEGTTPKPDDDPFAPVGIKLGSFTLRPAIEQGITATSNADSSSTGRSAVLSQTTLRFTAASDWENNSATAYGYGILRKTLSGQDIHDAQGRVEGQLNLDLDHEWRAIGTLGYEAAPESATSPSAIEGTISQPLRQSFDGSIGLQKELGKAQFGLTGAATHDSYGDADLSTGGVVSQKDRDSTLYTATLRGGYQISPVLTPFVELEGGRRVFDQTVDDSGYERSSNRIAARGGLAFDQGDKLSGQLSAGWIRENFEDGRLAPISGATVDADVKWSPERGTTVDFTGQTTLEDTTSAGESGSILYSGKVAVERRIRSDLTANTALGLDWRDYSGTSDHDLIYSAEAGFTWWMNRYAGIVTRARTERLTSTMPGRAETTNSIYVGLTVQK